MRYAGKADADWDVEAMLQTGHVGQDTVGAWAFGALGGYTFAKTAGTPRIGIQVDGASGDAHPGDRRVGTFNPMFPNGYYFTLAGYTGYSNLIHVKPSLTFKPASSVTVLTAVGFQWRQTTADAIYGQGMSAVPGTAGKGGAWTGMYAQARVDWLVNANTAPSRRCTSSSPIRFARWARVMPTMSAWKRSSVGDAARAASVRAARA